MSLAEIVKFLAIVVVSVIGCYQVFFWITRNAPVRFQIVRHSLGVDRVQPIASDWVWVYAPLYYAFIGGAVVTRNSTEHAVETLVVGLGLFLLHCAIHFVMPTSSISPPRNMVGTHSAQRLFGYIVQLDNGRGGFPSLHTSLSFYLAGCCNAAWGVYSYLLAVLISVSCLVLRRHVYVDVIVAIPIGILFSRFVS